MNEQENTLLYGPVRAGLVRFALPVILSMLATQLYTVADTMVIGLRLDAAALAAVSNASTVLMIFLFVSGGMELGGGLLLAAKRPTATREELCAMTYNLLLIDGAIGLLMMALGYGGIEQFLRWINTPAEILPEAARYAWFYLPGLPCLMLYDLAKQIVIGSGDSKTPLYAVLFTSVLNVGLDIVLVGPFGVAGAAAATAFAVCGKVLPDHCLIEVKTVIGRIGLAGYAPAGSEKLAEEVKREAADADVIFLQNHGVITCGTSPMAAFNRMDAVENAAKTILMAKLIGEIKYF